MPTAEIIAIGTELLLGEIQDTNTRYLARILRGSNIDLYRSTVIGDNSHRISELIKEALSRSDIIITSGGLGPTVDDPTRLAVALAIDSELVFLPELWDQIVERFKRYKREPTENNRRQAYIPKGAIPVENPVGTAPAFVVEIDQKCIISLPGVPRELEYLTEAYVMPYLTRHYQLKGVIKVMVAHTAGIGESLVDEQVADLELLSNPTVGLLAHPGQTDIRITAKAESEQEAESMIQEVLQKVIDRLGKHIYGYDQNTLESTIHGILEQKGLKLNIFQYGAGDAIREDLKDSALSGVTIESVESLSPQLFNEMTSVNNQNGPEAFLGIELHPQTQSAELNVYVKCNGTIKVNQRSYGGPIQNAPSWAVNTGLDFLRRCLLDIK